VNGKGPLNEALYRSKILQKKKKKVGKLEERAQLQWDAKDTGADHPPGEDSAPVKNFQSGANEKGEENKKTAGQKSGMVHYQDHQRLWGAKMHGSL